ncbi:glycoside hydrolase superfamily [Penicillium atrosanguineum]|nr:glycoside hydrolase superfamily [Penicillium atrosanguineum]
MVAKERHVLGDGWRCRPGDNIPESVDPGTWTNAQPLPTSIHLDLLADDKIPDPFPAKNEELVQWVGNKTWIYEKRFTTPRGLSENPDQRIFLVFEGLDTYTTISLDGKTILETNNMFVGYRVEVTEKLRPVPKSANQDDTHILQITFHNVEEKAVEEMNAHPEHSWFSFHFGSKRLAVRKAQYHFGWDWGPVLKDCGPWKPIYLEVYQSRATDLSIATNISPDHKEATLEVALSIDGKADSAKIEIECEGINVESRIIDISSKCTAATIRVHSPKLWWPWTLGEQNLYTIKATLFNRDDKGKEIVLDTIRKRFGIRKIELVQQPLLDAEGSSFFFRVNGVPLFAAGSCWVPADSFVTRATSEKYRKWIQLAKDSNQAMIRIWGGGIYEHDAFFDACDELGILVWHDFMFACGIYPAYPSYEENVMTEARQNIIRLRHHPCIAVWCGNNEDYAIAYLAQAHRGAAIHDPAEMEVEKIKESGFPGRLFYEIRLPALCKELIPEIPYWPGSPYGGSFCNAATEGDVHQWHVWHLDKFPYQDYPRLGGRMVTEFGLQSVPHWRTVKQYYPSKIFSLDDVRDYGSDEFMEWHNKGRDGANNIAKYGTDNIHFDGSTLRGYTYCSQLIQSEGVATAFRSWRRMWKGPGQEYCGGALVWQLNDCWPVSSWSIADCDYRPKMAYWAIKRENRPITVSLARMVNNDLLELEAWACNMTLHSVPVSYRIQAWDVRTGRHVWSHIVSVKTDLAPNRSTELGRIQFGSVLIDEGETKWSHLVFTIHLLSSPENLLRASPVVEEETIAHHTSFHEPLKEIPFGTQEDRVSVMLVQHESTSIIELRTTVPTKGVYLDFEYEQSAEWDDNGVDLMPGEVFRLRVTGLEDKNEHILRVYWLGEDGWQSQLVFV